MDATHSVSNTLFTGQTRAVMVWKLIEYLGLVLFLVIVPPIMGPNLYGRFAVLLSCTGLLTMITGLGAPYIFGRFVPEYEARREKSKTQALFVQLFFLRLLIAGLLVGVFLLLFPYLLPEASPLAIAAGAGSLFFGILAPTCFQLFYGLNALGKWLSQEALTKPFLILLLIALGRYQSLEGAAIALFGALLGVFILGLYWSRHYFTLRGSACHFSFLFSHLRFGLLFFAANLLLLAVWRGGEMVVIFFSGDSTEVAFFSIAAAIAMAFSELISQITVMTIPSLTGLQIAREEQKTDLLMGFTFKYLTVASILLFFIVSTLGQWAVEMVIGKQYLPVATNLEVLALGFLPIVLVRTGIALAVVRKQPGKLFWVTGGALGMFTLTSAVLVPNTGSIGASTAVSLALISAAGIAYYQFSLAPVLAAAHFWRTMLLALVAFVVMALPLTPAIPTHLLATVLFTLLLFWSKVVSVKEIQQIGLALTLKDSGSSSEDKSTFRSLGIR